MEHHTVADPRIARLRSLIAQLEQSPRSTKRDILLHAARERVVTLEAGPHSPAAWLSTPLDDGNQLPPAIFDSSRP